MYLTGAPGDMLCGVHTDTHTHKALAITGCHQ